MRAEKCLSFDLLASGSRTILVELEHARRSRSGSRLAKECLRHVANDRMTITRRGLGGRQSRCLATLAIVKLFADQAIPIGGVSGTILLMRGLARRDIPPRITMAALLVDMVTYYGAYLIVVLIGVGLLLANHKANGLILVGAAVFTIMVVAVPGSVLWARHLGRLPLPTWTARFSRAELLLKALVEAPSDLLRNRNLFVRVSTLQLSIFLLDALTLWFSFRALGSSPAFWISYVAFVVASAAATISVIPLGLGSFEAASVMVLHLLGVSLGRGLAATLLLRILTFWSPMIPGLLLTRREFQDED